MAIVIGGIVQESNTFNPSLSTMEHARNQHFYIGDEVKKYRERGTLAGFITAAEAAGEDWVPSLYVKLGPSGKFASADFEQLKKRFVQQFKHAVDRAQKVDGVFLVMHGAMVAEGCDDVEGEITGLVREMVGSRVPFVISFDPHANVTKQIIEQVNGIVAFKTYPHIDLFETGTTAAKLLLSMIRKEVTPYMAMRKLPMIVPAENSQSQHGPFADLLAAAEHGEQNGDAIVTSIFPLQPWLDIEELGAAVVVVASDRDKAEREADRLAELMWSKRHEFDVQLYQVRQVVSIVLEEKAVCAPGEWKPFVISDSADSPGAGASGDGNFVLKELLAIRAHEQLTCLLNIVDAPAALKAAEAGVGAELELTVGHTIHTIHGTPVTVRGKITYVGDGRFTEKSGREVQMGRSVVLQIGGISLVIQQQPAFSNDPALYTSMGLDPTTADVVGVRSATQFRYSYEPIARRILILDSPGFSTPNLKSLVFHHIKHPFYPFEDDFDWRTRQ